MPISYTTLPFEQLLCHEGAYNLINIAGHLRFENWNINEFEQGLLGCNGTRYIRTTDDRAALLKPLQVLDRMMPLCRFGEEGQHYAYELFLSKPEHWGYRGDPFFWAYAARKFTYDKLPMDEEDFAHKYRSIIHELKIPFGENEHVFIERFAAGGMSSGMVSGRFAQEALDQLKTRLSKCR